MNVHNRSWRRLITLMELFRLGFELKSYYISITNNYFNHRIRRYSIFFL